MVLALHALPRSSQVAPLNLPRRVCATSHKSRGGGGFFPLLDSMHVKYLVEIFKDKNYDQHNMLRKISEPNLLCHMTTVLP